MGILGSGAFVDRFREEEPLRERLAPGTTLPDLIGVVAAPCGLDADAIHFRSRLTKQSEARAVACHLAVRLLGTSGREVGELLNMGRSAVSQAVCRGENILNKNNTEPLAK